MWGKFLAFGTISAGVIAIFTICQWIKMTIDILIRGYTLHSLFGWSFRLLGALWGTVTTHLITREPRRNNRPGPELIVQDEPYVPEANKPTPPSRAATTAASQTTSAVTQVDDKIRFSP